MPKVLAVFAHPDDVELLCAGTLRLLVEAGWQLDCATLSAGDLGATSGTRDEIRERRIAEAAAGAETLGGTYAWLGLQDFEIYYCPEQLKAVTDQVRKSAPDAVITHSRECYMADHSETARLTQMACFASSAPLYETGTKPLGAIPVLYYTDPIEGIDHHGFAVEPENWVDVTETFSIRQGALACHESQREWLRAQHGIDDYLEASERLARASGEKCGVQFAEALTQHRGHAFPRGSVIEDALASHLRRNARFGKPGQD